VILHGTFLPILFILSIAAGLIYSTMGGMHATLSLEYTHVIFLRFKKRYTRKKFQASPQVLV
jgi:hypothetical protein